VINSVAEGDAQMRTSRGAGAIAGALAIVLACGQGAVAAADPGIGSGRGLVKICHRTSSLSHPYELLKVRRDSAQFTRHLQHRAYTDRHGFRDVIDGVDGRIQSLEDCPEWWDLQSDWPYKAYKNEHRNESRHEHRNRQEKLRQKQGQDLHIHLYDKKKKQRYETYKPREIKPARKPRARKLLPRGVRPKGDVRSS
jgi:hypothetical protein